MKTYKANNNINTTIHKRVKKVHKKAKFVGMLYFLGIILMVACACLPTLVVGNPLWVSTFIDGFSSGDTISLISSVLYALVLFIAVLNFLRSLGKLGNLLRKNYTKVGKMKKNMQAMDDMGKLFSGSFAAIICLHFFIYIIQSANAAQLATLDDALALGIAVPVAYITLGVGLFVHFFAGILHGKVSNFQIGGQTAQIVEEKRENGVFVFFVRNLFQVAVAGVIVYFFATSNLLLNQFILDMNAVTQDMMGLLIPCVLQILVVLFTLVLIKHATAPTEFNLYGMHASGMKNFRVFAFFTFIAAAALLVIPIVNGGAFDAAQLVKEPVFFVAVAAFVGFLLDCIIKPRKKKEKAKEEEEEEYPENFFVAPMSVAEKDEDKKSKKEGEKYPVMGAYPVMQQNSSQPVYVPVYYPMPQSKGCCAAAANCPAANKPVEEVKNPKETAVNETCKKSLSVKKSAREKRRELKAQKKDLKNAKKEMKKGNKIAKKNRKEELKLKKKELKTSKKFAKKNENTNKKYEKACAKVDKQQSKLASAQAPETVAEVTPVVALESVAAVAAVAPVAAAVEQEPKVEVEETKMENKMPLDPNKEWKVRCPRCGKLLLVKEVSPYHRCPACDKIFEIRKFETFVKKD